MLRHFMTAALALSLTAFATANDIDTVTRADIQPIVAGTGDTGGNADDMANFLALVDMVVADIRRSADPAGDSDNGVATATVARLPAVAGHRHQRHLGLGFAHGMSNIKRQSTPRHKANPHNDVCHGNGHSGNSNGNGHGNHGNGFGHRDCGDPSPSD